MYWDSTGDWRLKYYKELHQRDDRTLSLVEKCERDLDILEYCSTIKLLEYSNINSILDIGCGIGRQITYYASMYPQKFFTGIDISGYQIHVFQEIIKERQLSNVIARQMDATDVNSLENQFDLVTFYNNSFGCLSAEQQKKCLKDLLKLICPCGYLLLGCFDRLDLAEMCYREWGLTINKIDDCGFIDLGDYQSCWKSDALFIPFLEDSSFHCCTKQSSGLGSVYIFQNNA